jgi:hypothetical protein
VDCLGLYLLHRENLGTETKDNIEFCSLLSVWGGSGGSAGYSVARDLRLLALRPLNCQISKEDFIGSLAGDQNAPDSLFWG